MKRKNPHGPRTDGHITLHPEQGLNVHLMICVKCGGDSGEIALLGHANRVYTCKTCGLAHWGHASPPREGCQKCQGHDFDRREIEQYERVPGGICSACRDKQKACSDEVQAGGVYLRCKKCGSEGAIKADCALAALVREKTKIGPPDPVGVELDECPQCEDGKAAAGLKETADEADHLERLEKERST